MARSIDIGPDRAIPESELHFEFARSSGPGGQNVNKVSTKVDLLFDVRSSPSLSDPEKHRIMIRLKNRIDANGVLRISAQESRSQWRNREEVVEKFAELLVKALAVPKKRKPTRSTAGAKKRRLESKRRRSAAKVNRTKVTHVD